MHLGTLWHRLEEEEIIPASTLQWLIAFRRWSNGNLLSTCGTTFLWRKLRGFQELPEPRNVFAPNTIQGNENAQLSALAIINCMSKLKSNATVLHPLLNTIKPHALVPALKSNEHFLSCAPCLTSGDSYRGACFTASFQKLQIKR